jgi:segregation and condensation protein A
MGVTVTFLAILELLKEALIDVIQAEPYASIHVRAARSAQRQDQPTQA